jgi:hypothetical protein
MDHEWSFGANAEVDMPVEMYKEDVVMGMDG